MLLACRGPECACCWRIIGVCVVTRAQEYAVAPTTAALKCVYCESTKHLAVRGDTVICARLKQDVREGADAMRAVVRHDGERRVVCSKPPPRCDVLLVVARAHRFAYARRLDVLGCRC